MDVMSKKKVLPGGVGVSLSLSRSLSGSGVVIIIFPRMTPFFSALFACHDPAGGYAQQQP